MSDAGQQPAGSRQGIIFVISAPSGTGKTSLCKEIIDFFPGLRHSVSYTTRAVRRGEREGVDYFFVSDRTFDGMVERGEFAEWAEVHGNRYGTATETLERCRKSGQDVVLDIDCQGAAQLKENLADGVFIFILPPSLKELQRRLQGRDTDAPDIIERRMTNARREIGEARWYDYLVINDDFAKAREQLRAVVIAERCRTSRLEDLAQQLLEGR